MNCLRQFKDVNKQREREKKVAIVVLAVYKNSNSGNNFVSSCTRIRNVIVAVGVIIVIKSKIAIEAGKYYRQR